MRLFIACLALLFATRLAAQTETPADRQPGPYRPTAAFLAFSEPNCFEVTSREADRAYRLGYWDDAAALYRAAKSCDDANQDRRQRMNLRIEACRLAAENELRASEQRAVRKARNNLASNRAHDAQELLHRLDRTIAYRLADFANKYIAPEGEDNADCLQAMFDAWYYVPSKHTELAVGYDSLRIPLCYQLGENLGNNVLVRYAGAGDDLRIYAYSASSGRLYRWDAATYKPEEPDSVGVGMMKFAVSPGGLTLVFANDTAFLLWRNPRDQQRLRVPRAGAHAFSEDGNTFFYFDPDEQKIQAVNLRANLYVQQQVQQKRSRRETPPEQPISWAGGEPLALAAPPGQLWLGFPDSVVVLERGGADGYWRQAGVWKLDLSRLTGFYEPPTLIELMPDIRTVVMGAEAFSLTFRLPADGNFPDEPLPMVPYGGMPLGVRPHAFMVAAFSNTSDLSAIYFKNPMDSLPSHIALVPPTEFYANPFSGAFSPDGSCFTVGSGNGTLRTWSLYDFLGDLEHQFPADGSLARLSADGGFAARLVEGTVEWYDLQDPARPEREITPTAPVTSLRAMSDRWLAFQTDSATLQVQLAAGGREWRFPVEEPTDVLPVAFDPEGRFLAYAISGRTVRVMDLASGAERMRLPLEGSVSALEFVPRTGELLVVSESVSPFTQQRQRLVRVWDFRSGQAPRSIRLHGYNVEYHAVSDDGTYAAFSDGVDIRVYRLDNLVDEQLRIRAYKDQNVFALAFSPDQAALAVGYVDGRVVFWDINTGKLLFYLMPTRQSESSLITELRFREEGRQLLVLTSGNFLYSRALDPGVIRAMAQGEHHFLAAFQPEQIRDYELEEALNFPGNFERLANSGDLPLIRSFFDYYNQQSLFSNNTEGLKYYTDRAMVLYSKLSAEAREAQRYTLLGLLEDAHWKLLLRGKEAEAGRIAQEIDRTFDRPLLSQKAAAHSALLRHDLPLAARKYVDWTMQVYEETNESDFQLELVNLEKKFRELAQYGLLQADQIDCICGLYGNLAPFQNFCGAGGFTPGRWLDAPSALTWNVFQGLYASRALPRYYEKARLLESTLAPARQLALQKPAVGRRYVEEILLALAETYHTWSVFEQVNAYGAELNRKSIRLLQDRAAFPRSEAGRLQLLAQNHLNLGHYLMINDQLAEAGRSLQQGIQAAEALVGAALADTTQRQVYRDNLLAPLLSRYGLVLLRLGETEAATQAFERVGRVASYGADTIYLAHAALLEGREADAMQLYQRISTEQALGEALFNIGWLAGHRPDRRLQLEKTAARLKNTLPAALGKADSVAFRHMADYYRADLLTRQAFSRARYDSALHWSTDALRAIQAVMNDTAARFQTHALKTSLMNEYLNQSYYLLYRTVTDTAALSRSIRIAQSAERYIETSFPYYDFAELFKTNLGHAYLLRNGPGDRETALGIYRSFLQTHAGQEDAFELLLKDFRDLARAGIRFPDLRGLIEAILPQHGLSEKEWKELLF
jgi:WD40 repeat protein